MHPAFSVILFTTLSGSGFGLLAWAACWVVLAPTTFPRPLILVALLLGMLLSAAGLIASLFHLGQPLRAWRAFSQWRSSWLSREGVLAVLTLVLAVALSVATIAELAPILLVVCALALAIATLLTIYATAMIYRSLKTVPAWHNHWTVLVYLSHALFVGWLWFWFLAICCAIQLPSATLALSAALGALAASATLLYWRRVDGSALPASLASATGLLGVGTPRVFERPHSEESFVTREMAFVVARRHATRLRHICLLLLLLSTAAVLLGANPGIGALAVALLAIASASLAIVLQRWLFFAEARHVVALYFGPNAS